MLLSLSITKFVNSFKVFLKVLNGNKLDYLKMMAPLSGEKIMYREKIVKVSEVQRLQTIFKDFFLDF